MVSLTRVDPFEDVFRGFFRPVRLEDAPNIQMKIDVKEDEHAYKVLADIPGVNKEDILVNIESNHVSIGAETKQEKEVKEGERVLRAERYYGKIERNFSLEHEVDEGAASAAYNNGVLELTLPKKVSRAAKRLTIN
ncbi:MAG TPA: Hsp20/alpha crystallin family protein [Methylophilus sp.]